MKAANQAITMVTDERSESWKLVPIKDVADINPKLDKSTIPDKLMVSFVPMQAVGAGDGTIDVSNLRPAAEVKKGFTNFQEGDVLFAKITPCMENGKMAIVPKVASGYGFGSTEFHVLRPKNGLDPRYLYYFVSSQSVRKEAAHNMTGAVGQKRVSTSYIADLEIPLAPSDQQRLIVAEIEKQFSRLDEAVANLKRVKANLKRYKAAVLKAAVEGKLTEKWRKTHPNSETGEELLKGFLAERRKLWEKKKSGKYTEPVSPEISNLTELPKGWVWTTLSVLLVDIESGKSFKCAERPPTKDEIGVVKVSAVSWGEFDETESKTCLDNRLIKKSLLIQANDFLFSRANTIELVGACVIVKKVVSNVMLSDKILRFRLLSGLGHWVLYNLRSKYGRQEIERLATGNQESMRNIGQERIRAIRIPLPPIGECRQIVSEIERRLSIVGEVEDQVGSDLKRAERLRQAILNKAFSGQILQKETNNG